MRLHVWSCRLNHTNHIYRYWR